jgi:hypothetical protein
MSVLYHAPEGLELAQDQDQQQGPLCGLSAVALPPRWCPVARWGPGEASPASWAQLAGTWVAR